MNEDFPAAHSMDTQWFAIDADGFVAMFDSGEPGAVPRSAPSSNSGARVDEAVIAARPAAPMVWDLASCLALHGAQHFYWPYSSQRWQEPRDVAVVFVRDEAALEAAAAKVPEARIVRTYALRIEYPPA